MVACISRKFNKYYPLNAFFPEFNAIWNQVERNVQNRYGQTLSPYATLRIQEWREMGAGI